MEKSFFKNGKIFRLKWKYISFKMELYFIQPKQIIIPQTFIYVMILSSAAFYAVFPSSLNHSPRTAKNTIQRAIRAVDAPRNNYYA